MSEALRAAYAPERLGREWGYRDAVYATGRHRGLDVRKQNDRRTASVITDVIAIHRGRVVYVGRPNKSVELTVVIDRGEGVRGRFEFHSHCADPGVWPGAEVRPGDRLARNAGMNERPGLIDGSHDHIVISDWSDGAWNTNRPTYDPAPFIRAALDAAAPKPPKPAPVFMPPTEGDNPEMFIAKIKNGKGENDFAYYLVVPQGNGKPRAILLGSEGYRDNVKDAPIPIIGFVWQPSIDSLRVAVEGL